jgi:hypothetical protein
MPVYVPSTEAQTPEEQEIVLTAEQTTQDGTALVAEQPYQQQNQRVIQTQQVDQQQQSNGTRALKGQQGKQNQRKQGKRKKNQRKQGKQKKNQSGCAPQDSVTGAMNSATKMMIQLNAKNRKLQKNLKQMKRMMKFFRSTFGPCLASGGTK